MRILGIDPSLSCTGYGLVEQAETVLSLIEGGVVRTSQSASLEVRLTLIAEGMRAVIKELEPEVVVVEALYSQYRHPETAILMGHARGVILLAAAERGLEVVSYPASLVKRSLTGNGRASKEQVAQMVSRALGLAEPPQPNDVTDAIALCLCHLAPLRRDAIQGGLPSKIAEALVECIGAGREKEAMKRHRSHR